MNNQHHINRFTSNNGIHFTNINHHGNEQSASETIYPNIYSLNNKNKKPNGLSILINTDKKFHVFPNVPDNNKPATTENPHAFFDRNQNIYNNNKNPNYYYGSNNNYNNQNSVTKRPIYYYKPSTYKPDYYSKPEYGKPDYNTKPNYNQGFYHQSNNFNQNNYNNNNYHSQTHFTNGGSNNPHSGSHIYASNSIYNHNNINSNNNQNVNNNNNKPQSAYDHYITSTSRPEIIVRPQVTTDVSSYYDGEDEQTMQSLGHTQGFRGKFFFESKE